MRHLNFETIVSLLLREVPEMGRVQVVRGWSVRFLGVTILATAIIAAAAAAQTTFHSNSSDTGNGLPRELTGAAIQRALIGNTLLAQDENGPFWMYFPKPGTVWGQSSSGDVDIGHWWTDHDRYCRRWRKWYGGTTQCWTLAEHGDHQIIWIDRQKSVQGETLIQSGNTIGIAAKIASVAPDVEVVPIAVTGTIGPERRLIDRDPGRSSTQDSSGNNGGSSGASSSGDGSSGASSGSGSGGSSGGSDGGSGGNGSGNGKGKGGTGGNGKSGDKG
jgi:hypothetical protein